MPLRLRAADARVARLEALKQRTPPTHRFFGIICVLLRFALTIKMVVATAEGLQLSAGLLRPDYYYEDGLPPRPCTFDELERKHHAHWRE